MKTIESAELNKFRQGELLQLMNNVLEVYKNYDTKALMLDDRVTELANAVLDMDAVFMNPVGNPMTSKVKRADEQRLKTLRGIRLAIQAQQYSNNEKKAMMASEMISHYRKNADDLLNISYQQKTAVIKALLKDWNTEPTMVNAIDLLGIKAEVDALAEQNQSFDQTFFARAITVMPSAQTSVKRERITGAYNELTWDTMSFARVATDKTPYLSIINELNSVIEDNYTPVSQRMSTKKRNKGTTIANETGTANDMEM